VDPGARFQIVFASPGSRGQYLCFRATTTTNYVGFGKSCPMEKAEKRLKSKAAEVNFSPPFLFLGFYYNPHIPCDESFGLVRVRKRGGWGWGWGCGVRDFVAAYDLF